MCNMLLSCQLRIIKNKIIFMILSLGSACNFLLCRYSKGLSRNYSTMAFFTESHLFSSYHTFLRTRNRQKISSGNCIPEEMNWTAFTEDFLLGMQLRVTWFIYRIIKMLSKSKLDIDYVPTYYV